MVFEKIRSIIATQLDIDPNSISMDSYFIDDLNADSLDVMEMVMEIEGAFDIEINEDSLMNIKQVSDVVEYFENM